MVSAVLRLSVVASGGDPVQPLRLFSVSLSDLPNGNVIQSSWPLGLFHRKPTPEHGDLPLTLFRGMALVDAKHGNLSTGERINHRLVSSLLFPGQWQISISG
jgi:hypothetical protein